jgi:hypothetical protein
MQEDVLRLHLVPLNSEARAADRKGEHGESWLWQMSCKIKSVYCTSLKNRILMTFLKEHRSFLMFKKVIKYYNCFHSSPFVSLIPVPCPLYILSLFLPFFTQ